MVLEVGLVIALALTQIWVLRRGVHWAMYLAIGIVSFGLFLRRKKDGLEPLGLVAGRYAIPAALLFLGMRLIKALDIQGPSGVKGLIFGFLSYGSFALFQQLCLNSFFAKRLGIAGVNEKHIPVWAGIIFGLLHLPNLLLTLITLPGGFLASRVFLDMSKKNLYVIALVHTVIGMSLRLLPVAWNHHLAIGSRFH